MIKAYYSYSPSSIAGARYRPFTLGRGVFRATAKNTHAIWAVCVEVVLPRVAGEKIRSCGFKCRAVSLTRFEHRLDLRGIEELSAQGVGLDTEYADR